MQLLTKVVLGGVAGGDGCGCEFLRKWCSEELLAGRSADATFAGVVRCNGSPHLDTAKHVVDAARHVVDAARHVVDAAKHAVDAARHVVDAARHVVDAAKHAVDAAKHVVGIDLGPRRPMQALLWQVKGLRR
jgi:hypothetical protein